MNKSNHELVKIIENGSAKTFVYRPKDVLMTNVKAKCKLFFRVLPISWFIFFIVFVVKDDDRLQKVTMFFTSPVGIAYIFKKIWD